MSDFVLDQASNPHPRMLAAALLARKNAAASERTNGALTLDWQSYWRGYLKAMADATGCDTAELEAWMDSHE